MIRLAALICFLAGPGFSATCGRHDDMSADLAAKYGETPAFMGQTGGDHVMMLEVYANPKTGTWTAVFTNLDGLSCMTAAGVKFKAIRPGEPA